VLVVVWFLHQDGGGGLGLSSGGAVRKSVRVASNEIISAAAMTDPPKNPTITRAGMPAKYLSCIFIRWVSQYPETKGPQVVARFSSAAITSSLTLLLTFSGRLYILDYTPTLSFDQPTTI
jgi:hypothetical protein